MTGRASIEAGACIIDDTALTKATLVWLQVGEGGGFYSAGHVIGQIGY